MPYVITERCTRDGACVDVCPVACIHTTPGDPQFYIDPDVCIECEQCKIVCPVDAIYLDTELPLPYRAAADVNARFFRQNKEAVLPVGLDVAQQIIRGAQAYAAERDAAIAVAVVDSIGVLVAVSRMDGAPPHTMELALGKAHTAINFQVPTAELGPDAKRLAFTSLIISSRGRTIDQGGGVPILDGVAFIGAVGVAGARDAGQDVLCCRAGLSAVSSGGH
jgi:ferredoxin